MVRSIQSGQRLAQQFVALGVENREFAHRHLLRKQRDAADTIVDDAVPELVRFGFGVPLHEQLQQGFVDIAVFDFDGRTDSRVEVVGDRHERKRSRHQRFGIEILVPGVFAGHAHRNENGAEFRRPAAPEPPACAAGRARKRGACELFSGSPPYCWKLCFGRSCGAAWIRRIRLRTTCA